jgi:predicted negative regulator of RcsB-dependent stress response
MKHLLNLDSFALVIGGIIFSMGFVACTHFPNQNIDATKNNRLTYQKDLNECKEDHPESSAGLHYSRWIDCMNLKGWR